ncbi:hypothetical protein [Succinimonas sp.]|uniref:hypothetical protein n=1 Tax=Succinimonas sp. TaxID=1936151 RepID=UPI00386C7096
MFHMFKFKRSALSILVSAMLSAGAMAVTVDIDATGKDQDTAMKKASLQAVRNVMLDIKDKDFVKQHASEVRSQVLQNADSLITKSEVVSSASDDKGNVKIQARFEVDQERIAGILAGIENGGAPAGDKPVSGNDSGKDTGNSGAETLAANNSSSGTEDPKKTPAPKADQTPPEDDEDDEKTEFKALIPERKYDMKNPRDAGQFIADTTAREMARFFQDIGISGTVTKKPGSVSTDNSDSADLEFAMEGDEDKFTLTLTNSYSDDGVVTLIAADDRLYKDADEAEASLVKSILANTENRYSIKDDTAVTAITLPSGKLEEVSWDTATMEYKAYGVSNYQNAYNIALSFPKIQIATSEDGKDPVVISAIKGTVENRADSFTLNYAIGEFAGNFDGAMKLNSLGLSLEKTASASKKPGFIDYGLDLTLGGFSYEAMGIQISDASINLGLKELDMNSFIKACDYQKGEIIGFGSMAKCIAANTDNGELTDSLNTVFNPASSLNLAFKATLNSAKAEIKAAAGFAPDAAFSSIEELPGAVAATADISIDAALLSMQQYGLTEMAEILKKYAKDPEASALTYHLEFKGGQLLVNGKPLE